MRRRAVSRILRRASVGLLLLAGCEFVIADWYYVDRTRVMGTRAYVVEFNPAWPQRIGFDPLGPPITEPMPGDRLRLEAMIVDGEGRELDPETIDALWFQCGPDRCAGENGLVPGGYAPCTALPEWTMDDRCELGSGGAIEFVVPPVGQWTVSVRYGYYYMVAAVDDSRSAEDCWAARQKSVASLEGCLFADRELKVGPSWILLVEAALAGLSEDIPVTEIPAPAFGQTSNRIPVLAPIPATSIEEDNFFLIGTEPVQVRPGDRFTLVRPDWRPLFDYQVYFAARQTPTPGSFVFVPSVEVIWIEWYTSGSLVRLDDGAVPGFVDLLIDEQAKPGTTSRLIVLWGDDRGAEDMRVIEFEVGE
jgi:hypothetical protein